MGLRNLSGLCFAFLSFSSLAADPPVPRSNVSVTLNPTTSYYSSTSSTFRIPNGVSVSPVNTSVPVVTKYPAGLQQTIPTGITIDAIKKTTPLSAVVRSSTQSLKVAATRCLTSARCNVGAILAGEGLSRLFDGLDWVMGEGGEIKKKSNLYDVYQGVPANFSSSNTSGYYVNKFACERKPYSMVCVSSEPYNDDRTLSRYCYIGSNGSHGIPLSGFSGTTCYYGGSGYNNGPKVVPVSDSEIELGVNSNYNPEPSDWPALTPELKLDDVEITSAPTLQGEPKTTTVYDADGNPVKVQETNTWYQFDVRDNPSSSPSLDLKTREQTKTYEDGVLTDTTETESTSSGGAVVPKVDIPTDCDFMPTVCAFLDWFKKDDVPDDPDLSALIDNRDFTETYSITGGSKQCPADYEFTVDFIGRTYGLSFEPACDFASKIYYFVMAAAYIFAAYITIGASRNG